MEKIIRILGVGLALFVIGPAFAQQIAPATGLGVTRLVIAKRQIAYGGASFGSAGPYEILNGTAYGELDPRAPGNAGIVNANRAPLNARGHVECSVDFMILKPVDAKKGNGRLLCDFVNRGKNTSLARLNESGDTFAANDSGNGFLMNRGYTIAWSGASRLSIEERYKSAQEYADKRKHAVDALVQQGFVLPEDADALARSMPLPGPAQGKL